MVSDMPAVLARFLDGPIQLEMVIAGLSEAQLDLALDADSWSIRQYAHHIVDGDDLWRIGIKAALGNIEREFGFSWYWEIPQDTWAERWAYSERPLEPSLALLRAGREQIAPIIQLLPNAWERSLRVRWPNGQEQKMTVGDIIEMQAGHLFQHIDDIRAIRAAHQI